MIEHPIEPNLKLAVDKSASDDFEGKFIDPLENKGILKKAKEHGSAQAVNNIPDKYEFEKVEFCECCQLPIRTPGIIQPYPFCVNIKELSKCGIGTYLYFYFFKYLIICLFIIVCMAIIPTLFINKDYSNQLIAYCRNRNIVGCEDYYGSKIINSTDWLYQMSYMNLNQTLSFMRTLKNENDEIPMYSFIKDVTDYNYINFLTMTTLFIVNGLFLVILTNLIAEADYGQITPSDFTLMISGISKDFANYDDLHKNFLGIDGNFPYEINLTFKLDEFFTYQNAINDARKKYKMIKAAGNEFYVSGWCCKSKIKDTELLQIIRDNQAKIEKFKDELRGNNNQNFTGVVYASFKNNKEYSNYYKQFPHNLLSWLLTYIHFLISKYVLCCLYSDSKKKKLAKSLKLKVREAPEPTDIMWENLQYDSSSRFWRSVIVYSLSLLLTFLSFSIIVGLNYFQNKAKQDGWSKNIVTQYTISCIVSIVINTVNFIITKTIYSLTLVQKKESVTEFHLALSNKLSIFLFINSGIVPLISNIITGKWNSQREILINNLLIIFLSNAFITPAYNLMNIFYFFRKIKRARLEKLHPNDEQEIPQMTQRELNELYENPDMWISYKYSYGVKTFLLTVFYLPLFPVGAFISIIGIVFAYQVEKFNLLNTYKRPQMLGSHICLFYVKFFKVFIFVYACGNYIFLNDVFDSNKWGIISLVLYGVLIFIPIHELFKCKLLGLQESEVLKKEYEECVLDFPTNYDRQNPITKKKGNQRYLERLKEAGYLTDDQYADLTKKMLSEDINMIELYYRNSVNINIRTQNQIANMFNYKYNQKKNIINGSAMKNAVLGNFKNHKENLLENQKNSVIPINNYRQAAMFNFMKDSGLDGYHSGYIMRPANININNQGVFTGNFTNNGFNKSTIIQNQIPIGFTSISPPVYDNSQYNNQVYQETHLPADNSHNYMNQGYSNADAIINNVNNNNIYFSGNNVGPNFNNNINPSNHSSFNLQN